VRELTTTAIAILFVTTLGIAVFALDDRQAGAAAPEAVAEGMVRELVANRQEQTLQYLSSYARAEYAAELLAVWKADIERRTGSITRVEATDVSIGEDLAEAVVTMQGKNGTVRARVSLVREAGTWKVESLPAN
jgi:hypothetical protein